MSTIEKIAVVTGGTRGIGFEIAKLFSQKKYTVIISGRDLEKTQKIAMQIEKETQSKVLGLSLDLSSNESCKNFVNKIIEKFKKIDVLINNAGITKDNLLLRMTEEQWTDVILNNLTGTFLITKFSIKSMLKQKKGRIVNISSIIGITGNSGQCNYAASKGGIIAFTKSIAQEFAAKGITCNSIAPGFIETDMTKTLPTQLVNDIITQVPVRRMGTSKEVADLALFLASDSSSYITGQTIKIDGGLTM